VKHELLCEGKHSEWFTGYSGGPSFPVAPNSVADYVITFKPTWVGKISGTLFISITETGDALEYELEGISTQPLAIQHFSLQVKTRERKKL
jgi:hypothetical protein